MCVGGGGVSLIKSQPFVREVLMSSVYQLLEMILIDLCTVVQFFEPQPQYGNAHMQTPAQIQGWLVDGGRGLGEAAIYHEEVLITFTQRWEGWI